MNKEDLRLLFFEEADVLFTIYDKDLNCIDINNATLKVFGAKREQIVGKNIKELNPDSLPSGRYQKYLDVLKTGKTLVIDEFKTSPNGIDLFFRIKVFKVGDGIGMVTKNITDLEMTIRRTAEELERKVASLNEANASINKMLQVVSNQNTQLNDFCGIVSHNLRAPLINLSMLADFIDECKDDNKREEMFSKVKPVTSTLNETFNHLVESLQIREELNTPGQKIDLMEQVQAVLKNHKIEIELYHVDVDIDFKEASEITYPQKYIESILENLISNSLKYRAANRTLKIRISTKKINDQIILSVSDNGLGIDLKANGHNLFKMRKVFHEHPEAKGFGLFMTKTQVESMGGKIWAESFVDIGSTFYIKFKPD